MFPYQSQPPMMQTYLSGLGRAPQGNWFSPNLQLESDIQHTSGAYLGAPSRRRQPARPAVPDFSQLALGGLRRAMRSR
jgi:hypothetical protein